MATALAASPADTLHPVLTNAPHRVGRVALIVRDLDLVSTFYQSMLGLRVLERTSSFVRLGTSESVLLELQYDPQARVRSRREAGLFHTAFLLPGRAHLGAWLTHASSEGLRLTGAADHLVSEALYLNDPEGNGIEIYVDRPSTVWRRTADMIDMATDPLDLDGLVRDASGHSWSGFPDQGVVGHVHLQVGDLAEADGFYRGLLGFDVTTRYPGASFYGSGGYHHQLAGNIWNSSGAPVRSDRSTGLADVELLVGSEVLEAVRSRRAIGEGAREDRITLHDPWGTSINLRSA